MLHGLQTQTFSSAVAQTVAKKLTTLFSVNWFLYLSFCVSPCENILGMFAHKEFRVCSKTWDTKRFFTLAVCSQKVWHFHSLSTDSTMKSHWLNGTISAALHIVLYCYGYNWWHKSLHNLISLPHSVHSLWQTAAFSSKCVNENRG